MIALYDNFDSPVGQFGDYQTYDPGQLAQLSQQRHVDIRSFEQASIEAPYSLFDLDHDTVGDVDGLSMSALVTAHLVREGEYWTTAFFPSGTLYPSPALFPIPAVVEPLSPYSYFPGIVLTCSTGTSTSSSVMSPIDISAFTDSDYLSLALPALPLASLTAASCYLDLTSEPNGDFATGPTDSLAFSSSTATLITGDCEARFPLSQLTTIDRRGITGVRLRITATADCTVTCLAIRCLATTWDYAPIDQNTLYERVGATVPPSGALSQPYTFPAAGAPTTPADWPVLLFTDSASSGPAPSDITAGAILNTGFNSAQNTFALYLREQSQNVLAINSPDSSTMSILDAFPVEALDTEMITTIEALALDAMTLASLDRLGRMPDYSVAPLNDFATSRYLTVTLNWGTSGSLHVQDQDGVGYDFTGITLAPQSRYYLSVTLTEDQLRAAIHPISTTGVIDWGTVTFDTTAIIDGNFIKRRAGRFGWYAQFAEGSTYIEALRPRQVVYGEYRSAALRSATPVDGAQIFVDGSPERDLYGGAVATTGAVISADNQKSRSGRCLRIDCDGNQPLEGLSATPVRFENFADTAITFDILPPSVVELTALLYGENRLAVLYIPRIPVNRWTHVNLSLQEAGRDLQPGLYSFLLLQAHTGQHTFFIDNLSVPTKRVSWQGRGQAADPWRMNDPAWIKFQNTVNTPYGGALLGRGNALQIRAQALTQDAQVSGLKLLPKYAELGNFVWSDQAPDYGAGPVASFTTAIPSGPAHAITVDASASTAASGIVAYRWSLGDDTADHGQSLTHTYQTGGSYTITLTVIDALAQKTSVTHTVDV